MRLLYNQPLTLYDNRLLPCIEKCDESRNACLLVGGVGFQKKKNEREEEINTMAKQIWNKYLRLNYDKL